MTCITISFDHVENREIEIYFFLIYIFFFYDLTINLGIRYTFIIMQRSFVKDIFYARI